MLKKLRIKFVVTNMVIVALMLSFIFGFIYHFTAQSMEKASESMLRSVVERPFHVMGPGEKTDNVKLPYFSLQISKQGELIATGGGFYDLSDMAFISTIMSEVEGNGLGFGALREYNLRYYYSENHGEKFMVFADSSNEQATLRNMMKIFIVIGFAAFLAFLGIILLLARWEVKPVEKAWSQQRQFVSDASHELKTPLTVILTNAQLLQSGDNDEESRAKFVDSIQTMAQHMRSLVEQLLELARTDDTQNALVLSPVELSTLVSDAILPFEPVFYESGLSLESSVEPGISVKGSALQLSQVADILFDNARKYSSHGGKVSVSLQMHGAHHCLFSVSNTGEAIPQEDLKNIFKRFYREDKARSLSGGFGLGLSIAENIVSTHKGRIWAESADGVNSFILELPAHVTESVQAVARQ